MPRVTQLHLDARCVPDGDILPLDLHVNPFTTISILPGVLGVGVVHVEILLVGLKNGEAPCTKLVVANGNTGECRLASANDVPPRPHQVHPVAEGRHPQHAMGIVRHHRVLVKSASSSHHPIVAADGGSKRREFEGAHVGGAPCGRPACRGGIPADVVTKCRQHICRLERNGRSRRRVVAQDGLSQQPEIDR